MILLLQPVAFLVELLLVVEPVVVLLELHLHDVFVLGQGLHSGFEVSDLFILFNNSILDGLLFIGLLVFWNGDVVVADELVNGFAPLLLPPLSHLTKLLLVLLRQLLGPRGLLLLCGQRLQQLDYPLPFVSLLQLVLDFLEAFGDVVEPKMQPRIHFDLLLEQLLITIALLLPKDDGVLLEVDDASLRPQCLLQLPNL